jgi:uncharacterized damage-inducible protein DinB
MLTTISRPQPGEYLEYYQRYIDKVAHESEAVTALKRQVPAIHQLARLTPEQGAFRYADGKWSVRQVIGHLADSERIFVYRLLRAVRGDQGPLPGFDENAFVEHANFDQRTVEDLAGELAAVREATLAMLGTLDESKLAQTTVANNAPVSVRALAFIMAGHTAHHLQILRERYGVTVD